MSGREVAPEIGERIAGDPGHAASWTHPHLGNVEGHGRSSDRATEPPRRVGVAEVLGCDGQLSPSCDFDQLEARSDLRDPEVANDLGPSLDCDSGALAVVPFIAFGNAVLRIHRATH